MQIYLIDGTYELFRYYYALPSARGADGVEVAAVRGVVGSVLGMINGGVTHLAVATDHVIESFRNRLWRGYKTSAGIEPELLAQFHPLEDALRALGVVVWPMVEFEADDALASGAALAARDRAGRAGRHLHARQGPRAVGARHARRAARPPAECHARRGRRRRKFGVPPASIPDYLALVGDAADGYPGLRGWGPKSTAAVLAKFGHLEAIPEDSRAWQVNAANAATLAATFEREREQAFLFRDLATLRSDIPLFESVDELEWRGPTPEFARLADAPRQGRDLSAYGISRFLIAAALVQDEMRHVAALVLDERDLRVDDLEKDTSSPTPERLRVSPDRSPAS